MFNVASPTLNDGPRTAGGRLIDPQAREWERIYALLLHLTMLVHVPLPVVPALIMWMIKKGDSPFIDDHGREAINFQISLLIYYLVSGLLFACGIGVVLFAGVWVLGLVGMIMGAIAANKGEYYRYPACIRFLH